MRKGRDGEQKTEKNDGNSGPLSSLPVDPLKGDRLQRRRSCQKKVTIAITITIGQNLSIAHPWKTILCRNFDDLREKLFI